MKTLNSFDFSGKKALIRVDFNVPLNAELQVTDASRIEAAKPTIIHILEQGGSVILMSHLGRPDGEAKPEMSLKHIVEKTAEILGVTVQFCPESVGPTAQAAAEALEPGQILLLENLRYHNEETKGDRAFAEALAALGDIYVNDAFGTAHRAHASTAIIADFFKGQKCFGLLLEKEIKAIDKVLKTGEKPVTAIMGGSKVSSKITIIENILPAIDHLIVGGGMTYTFIKALGGEVGNSICETDKLDLALSILEKAKAAGVTVHIPVDVIAADDFSATANTKIVPSNAIPEGWEGLDAGPETLKNFDTVIMNSKTLLWNGPVGVFEIEQFSEGTKSIGRSVEAATKAGAFSLVGGGDSVAAVKQFGFEDKVSYVSTGGGAMLESLEGIVLPGIAAILED
ncbi:MAG: phosphoglycerate kinase [Bacteroidetes bacterium]|nr:phosphoglycerate kinase [Bacteroidota bacterium]